MHMLSLCMTMNPVKPRPTRAHAQGDEVVIEPYVMAREVSVTVIQSAAGPFALLPTEIELRDPEDLVIRSQLELDVQHAANEVRAQDGAARAPGTAPH